MSNIHGFGSLGGGGKKPEADGNEEFSVGGATSQSAVYRPTSGEGRGGGLHDQLLDAARRNQAQGAEAVGDKNLGNITLYKVTFPFPFLPRWCLLVVRSFKSLFGRSMG